MIIRDGDYTPYTLKGCDSLITSDYVNELIEQHKVFGWTQTFDLAKNSYFYIIADPSGVTKERVHFFPIFNDASYDGPIKIEFYKGTTFSAESELVGIDRNDVNPVTPELKFYKNASVISEGFEVPSSWYIFSGGNPASSRSGGTVVGNLKFVADTDYTYGFKYINEGTTTTAKLQIAVLWCEK